MTYIQIPGTGSMVAEIQAEDEYNYYVQKYGLKYTIPKSITCEWDGSGWISPWWECNPNLTVDGRKAHLMKIEIL